ncbi:hypothetical protein Osc1_05100 [Hominimerdicola sp. 21CYCFAH17_S]
MFSKQEIKKAYGDINVAVSESMAFAINEWDNMYCGRASWVNEKTGVCSLRIEQAIVREFSNTSVNEMEVTVSNPQLDCIFKNATKNLNKNLQRGLATGAMIIKPLGKDKVQYLPQSAFLPIEYDVNGRLVKVIFPEVKQIGDNDYRIRLEYHSLDKSGLSITNRAFESSDGLSLGREIPLSEVCGWETLPPIIHYPEMDRPAFGYYANPIDNVIDGTFAGVSVFDSAKDLIRLADIQFGRLDWEFESGERRIDLDDAAFREIESAGKEKGLEISRIYRSAGNMDELFKEFSPQLRQSDFISGLEEYKREIEFAVGLSYGDISDPQTVDKTATEVKSSKQRKYDTVTAIQENLRSCLDDLCYALAFYNCLTQSGYKFSVNFEDSVLTDDETKRNQDRQDVAMGVMPLWEYRMRWYGEDEATAKSMTLDSIANVLDEVKLVTPNKSSEPAAGTQSHSKRR